MRPPSSVLNMDMRCLLTHWLDGNPVIFVNNILCCKFFAISPVFVVSASFYMTYREYVAITMTRFLSVMIADKSQDYTQHAYMRPLGVVRLVLLKFSHLSVLHKISYISTAVAMVLGIDDENGPKLF
ncbi:proteasome subunit alpha type-6 [Tanacetum coccineum]